MLPNKRQISNWEQLLKINERPVIFTIIADKKKRFCPVFWEGFAKELTAEPTWAKYSKRWSSSGQVPPLVPIAKVKLNLLSAPLKLVSRDSELSLSHPSPQQGPKGDPLKEWGSEQFAFTFKPSRPNNPIVTLSISLYHNWHTNVMMQMPQTGNYRVLQKREEISKVKTPITMFQRGFWICSKAHVKKHAPICLSAQHQTPISTRFMNMSAIALRTHDCWINPAEVCDILYKKICEWVKNLTHTAGAQHVNIPHESKWAVVCQASVTSWCTDIRQSAAQ